MVRWRWDQGHLHYFQYDTIRAASEALVALNGEPQQDSVVRTPLEMATGMDFAAPPSHSLWRQYARVFGCALLATAVDKRVYVSKLCERVAGVSRGSLDVDEYFSYLIPRFYFPSPVFQGYSTTGSRVFPFCAILRLLLAKYAASENAAVTLAEVFTRVVGNNLKGTEPLETYMLAGKTGYSPRKDEYRQVREMLLFLSQFSFLKWYGHTLYLDLAPVSPSP